MEVTHPRCAGIDISKRDAKVCVRIAGEGRAKASVTVETYGSMTKDVLRLRDCLVGERVTCVVMEATGDYWKQFYYLLEDAGFEVILANARQVRGMPGRKSDVSDCQWLAELGAHGLVRASFVPPEPIRQLRDLTRLRTHLRAEQARDKQRLEKVLEDAGIKLAAVATNLTGVSARAMLAQLGQGTSPEGLADLARGTLRNKIPALTDALDGRFSGHHRFLVDMHLDRITHTDNDIRAIDEQIDALLESHQHTKELLVTIPGVSWDTIDIIIAETGGDMSVFPTAKHLVSWAGCAPGMNESAGRHKPARTRPGDPYLKGAIGMAALQAMRAKTTYLSALYHRIASRRGPMVALVAVEASILTSIWHMLTNNEPYLELGADYYQQRKPKQAIDNAIQRIRHLGFDVTLTPLSPAVAG
jgi:transposase